MLNLCLLSDKQGCSSVTHDTEDGVFYIRFTYCFPSNVTANTKVFFAFCYPWSYEECQTQLEQYDSLLMERFERNRESRQCIDGGGDEGAVATPKDCYIHNDCMTLPLSAKDGGGIYYHRELLVNSLDGLRVDLITISSLSGMCDSNTRETRIPGLFPDKDTPRARVGHPLCPP